MSEDIDTIKRHVEKAVDWAKVNPSAPGNWAQLALAEAALALVERLDRMMDHADPHPVHVDLK